MKKISVFLIICLCLSLFFSIGSLGAPPSKKDPSNNGEYIIKIKDDIFSGDNTLYMLSENAGLDEIDAEHGLYLAKDEKTLKNLEASDLVEYAEPNAEFRLADTYFNTLMAQNDTYYSQQWNLTDIRAEAAWDAGYNGDDVKIAIIDSGLNSTHSDLQGVKIAPGYNILNGTAVVADTSGHGTFVAGVIAAQRNNGIGIAGITDKVTIIPIKCFVGEATTSNFIISAIYKAVDDYKADVINLSLSSDIDLLAMRGACDYAVRNGVIIIAAAGNSGNDTPNYPAAYEGVVGVGSYDKTDTVSDFSQRNDSVFVTAPGEDIISLDYLDNNAYRVGAGTSFSVPHVSAAAAIIKQYSRAIAPTEFMDILKQTSRDLGPAGYDTSYGYGALDISSIIKYLGSSPAAPIFFDIYGHWARADIENCVRLGLFTGLGDYRFVPDGLMTRAMFITTLYRAEKEPAVAQNATFTDVPADQWYTSAVAWAAETGITEGISSTEFGTNRPISREQIATMLMRFAEYKKNDTTPRADISGYADYSSVSYWAIDALMWARAEGIVNGVSATSLSPGFIAYRAEVATMLSRYMAIADKK